VFPIIGLTPRTGEIHGDWLNLPPKKWFDVVFLFNAVMNPANPRRHRRVRMGKTTAAVGQKLLVFLFGLT
jgi:hypothetical protein